jgi:hypothetical protein
MLWLGYFHRRQPGGLIGWGVGDEDGQPASIGQSDQAAIVRGADQLFFNAARLDRSIALRTVDFLAIAKPRIEHIAREQKECQK